MKEPLEATLMGITNDAFDLSIDHLKYSHIPVLKRFIGSDENLELKIIKRGAKPDGGGEVFFKCPVKMKLLPIDLTDPGKIKRIRGIAYSMLVAPSICSRMIETAKGMMLKFLPDVYIVSDHQNKEKSGKSPAFGITLVAETKNGTFLCGEACSLPIKMLEDNRCMTSVPEEVAREAANNLIEEIYRGGCVDSSAQYITCLFMALNQNDVSRALIGLLSPFS
jgi:RNA 3'-terminal phosphate cyclase-like protein